MKNPPTTRLAVLAAFGAVLSASTAFAQFPQPILYLPLDEAAGAFTAVDQSGNDRNGTVNGTVNFGSAGAPGGSTPGGSASIEGGVIDIFDLDVPTLLGKRDGTPEQADISYTMAAWICPDAVSLSGDHFFFGQTTQGIHNGIRTANGTLHQAHWANDHNGTTTLTADEWVHATFAYDGVLNQGQIYLNGVPDGPLQSKDGPNGSGTFIVGSRQAGQGPYVGKIDEVVVWNELLTPAQIAALAAGTSPVDVEDDDGDALPDGYELRITSPDGDPANGNLTDLNGDAEGPGPGPGTGDFDGDGLTDIDEFETTRTNPVLGDTDEDGDDDGEEVDGTANSAFGNTPTDPLDADSDDDGTLDGAETSGSENVAFGSQPTDPNNVDTDMDGTIDSYETEDGFDPNLDTSNPDPILVQPNFVPINDLPAGVYEPGQAGWDFQQNFYSGGIIFNNAAEGNYTVHSTGDPAPNTSATSVQPFLDHGDGGVTIGVNNLAFPEGTGDNFTVRANAFVEFTQGGIYQLHHGADDTTYTVIEMPGVTPPVIAQNNCCPQDATTTFIVPTPGLYAVDFVFGEQGGGDWLDLGLSGPGIVGTVPLGDVGGPAVFTISFPADDTDGDGLPDFVEQTIIDADPNDAFETLADVLPGDDFDNDGLTNEEEFDNFTNAADDDSDDDGLTDGDEVNVHSTDPLAADGDNDGLNDAEELAAGTLPGDPDTDDDGLLDGLDPDPLNAAEGLELGLLAYWPMDGDLNNAFIDDFHGTEDGPAIPFETGKFDNAIHLDGSHSVVIGGDENVMDFEAGSMSVSVWCTVDVIDTNWQCLIAKGEGNGWRMHRRGGDNPPQMAWTGGNGDIDAHGTPIMIGTDPETWHHYVGITDGATQTQYLYQDGVLLGEKAGAILQNRANPMRIGENPDALGRLWKGKVDDVGIWGRALSEEEVLQIWDDGDGQSINDLLGGGTRFEITEILYNELTDEFTLTWTSKEGGTYGLYWSTDAEDWGNDIDDAIDGEEETTTYTFPHPDPGLPTVLFRIERN